MKLVIGLLFIFPTLVLAFSCPPSPAHFKTQKASFHKVYLVPGAGADEDELYLGYIHYGKYFSVYTAELKNRNIPFEVVSTFPNGNENLLERVNNLSTKLLNETEPVLLIGHSIGGLVARLALRRPEVAKKIAATITISTPHQGTPVADWILTDQTPGKELGILSKAFGFDIAQKNYIKEISVMNKDHWNTNLDHAAGINNIFSVVASEQPMSLVYSNPLFALGDKIIRGLTHSTDDFTSDGLIPLSSQVWGECLLTAEANHGSVIGKDFFHSATKDVLPNILKKLEIYQIYFRP